MRAKTTKMQIRKDIEAGLAWSRQKLANAIADLDIAEPDTGKWETAHFDEIWYTAQVAAYETVLGIQHSPERLQRLRLMLGIRRNPLGPVSPHEKNKP